MNHVLAAQRSIKSVIASHDAVANAAWFLAGGVALADCLAAYEPKGAGSLADSYINFAHPGTLEPYPDIAPTLSADGWVSNGTSTRMTITSLSLATSGTIAVKLSDVTQTSGGSSHRPVVTPVVDSFVADSTGYSLSLRREDTAGYYGQLAAQSTGSEQFIILNQAATNEFIRLILTWSGGVATLYRNGTSIGSIANANRASGFATGYTLLGSANSTGRYYKGTTSLMVIHQVGMTLAQVLNLDAAMAAR